MSAAARHAIPLAAILVLATLGRGGDRPEVMFLVHGAVAALVAHAWLRPGTGPRGVPDAASLAAYAAFAATALASAALAPYGYSAFLILQEWAVVTGLLWLGSRVGAGALPVLSTTLLAAAGAQGVWMVLQRFALDSFRPAGTLFNPNHLAAWLAATLLLAAGTARPSRGTRPIAAVLAVPALVALLLTGSRGAYLGAAAGAMVLFAPSWPGWSPARRRAVSAAALVVVAVAAGVLLQRFRSPDPFPFHRTHIWASSLEALREDPWLGAGPGQFRWVSRGLQFADGVGPLQFDRSFSTTHSDPVRLFAEYGLVGGALFLAALALVARRLRRMRPAERDAIRGVVAALAALAVHALVENLSHRPAIYLLAAVLLGILLSRPAGEPQPRSRLVRVGAAVTLLVAFLAGDAAPLVSWRMLVATPEGTIAGRDRDRLRHALAWNPLQPYAWAREAEARQREGDPLEGYAAAREAAEEAVRRNPLDPDLRLRLARIEATACRDLFRDLESRRRAAARFAEAETLAPTRITLALEKAEFLFGTSDLEGAANAARRALEVEPEAIPPRLLLARILLERDNEFRPEALRLFREAEDRASRYAGVPRDDAYTRQMLAWPEGPVRELESLLGLRTPDPR